MKEIHLQRIEMSVCKVCVGGCHVVKVPLPNLFPELKTATDRLLDQFGYAE